MKLSAKMMTRFVRLILQDKFTAEDQGETTTLRQAREVTEGKDIRIAGGVYTVLQYLNVGFVDELSIALAPVFLGYGIRLFDGIDRRNVALKIVKAIHSPLFTHLQYAVTKQ
ncbi:MAG TPA: dihydrofolate reductase family protein [Nitrospirota bacterium]|nr:dihydrofolate reductase family protein [Nitrospirota bacterium]